MSAFDLTAPPPSVAVVVARSGRLPTGAADAAVEAGDALVVGSGAEPAAHQLSGAARVWWLETGPGLRPASLAATLAPFLERVVLTVLPASPDGRDLAPRLAALLDRPLLAGAIRAETIRTDPHGGAAGSVNVRATVSRLDDRVLVPVEVDGPAVATLLPGVRTVAPAVGGPATVAPIRVETAPVDGLTDPDVLGELEPDLRTMDLADATRVVAGGAGLAAGLGDREATALFSLLADVATSLGGSVGATRVATDAGWAGYERQIGTTGVAVDPDLYVAFGISGATQHVGGLGSPRHLVSVNTDPSAPMTAMADLGLVTDARALLLELARREGLAVPEELQNAGLRTGVEAVDD